MIYDFKQSLNTCTFVVNNLNNVMTGKKVRKAKEREMAYFYYVTKGKTAKEAAMLVGVRENTLSNWVRDGGWKGATLLR